MRILACWQLLHICLQWFSLSALGVCDTVTFHAPEHHPFLIPHDVTLRLPCPRFTAYAVYILHEPSLYASSLFSGLAGYGPSKCLRLCSGIFWYPPVSGTGAAQHLAYI